MKSWKLTEIRFIRENLHLSDKELSTRFKVSETAIKGTRLRNKILRPNPKFYKGQTPFNKGMSYNPGGRSVETRFKKGHVGKNVRPVGTVFSMPGATGKQYQFIKLKTHRQYPYGRYVWEKHFKERLTKNDVIRFKDGDPQNCSIDNLFKVSRGESIKMNTNRLKSATSLKSTWAVVKTFEDFGLTPPYKFKSKRKSA